MKRTIKRIIYKHYLTMLALSVWLGIYLTFGIYDTNFIENFWGTFLIIAGLSLLFSERKFIKECNNVQGIND